MGFPGAETTMRAKRNGGSVPDLVPTPAGGECGHTYEKQRLGICSCFALYPFAANSLGLQQSEC